MKRISKEQYYLGIASAVAKRSTCLRRNYGAVIVSNDEIIATGYNGSPRGETNCCDVYEICPRHGMPHNSGDYSGCPAVHAEMNAMLSAPRDAMIGGTLYLAGFDAETGEALPSAEPCPICSRLIANAGITRVIGPQDIREGEIL